MVIGIFGESCVGKSTLAAKLQERLNAEVFAGKDYLRFAKNETIAKNLFRKKLADAPDDMHIVYVVSEPEHLDLLPDGALRVRMTADLSMILDRFAVRMRGNLPGPVRTMLEKKHGTFDCEPCDYHIHNNENTGMVCDEICGRIGV